MQKPFAKWPVQELRRLKMILRKETVTMPDESDRLRIVTSGVFSY
jgi:hypothetical protein